MSQLTCMQNLETMLLQLRDRHGKEMAFFFSVIFAIEAASYLHHQSENAKEKQLLGWQIAPVQLFLESLVKAGL